MTENAERLSPGTRAYLISKLQDRTASPGEVRDLLRDFAECAALGEPLDVDLLRCVGSRFAAFLSDDDGSLDESFLLVRQRRGHPGSDDARKFRLAYRMFKEQLDGASHQVALEKVSQEMSCGTTTVGKAWAEKREEVFAAFELMSRLFKDPLEDLEHARQICTRL